MEDQKKTSKTTRPTVEQLRAEIERVSKENQELVAENVELLGKVTSMERDVADAGSERIAPHGRLMAPIATSEGIAMWDFVVCCISQRRNPTTGLLEPINFPERTIRCNDSSEAVRLYCLQTKDPNDPHGRPIDASKYRFVARCDDPEYHALIEKGKKAARLAEREALGLEVTP